MRRFRDIIEDIKAPSPQDLWLNGGELKFFGPNGWTSLIGEGDEDRQELEEKVDSLDKEMGTANNNITKLQNSKLSCLQLQIGNSDEVKQHNLKALSAIAGFFFTKIDYGYGVGTFQAGVGGFAHVVTAYDNATYYDIAANGSISKNSNYISPNEPYTVSITEEQTNEILDDLTASKVSNINCGEIILSEANGPIRYIKSGYTEDDRTYFVNVSGDDKHSVLTYHAHTKYLSLSISYPYTPTASIFSEGTVKKARAIADLVVESASVESVAMKLNDLLTALRASGVLQK